MKPHIREMAASDIEKASELYEDANHFTTRKEIYGWTRRTLKNFPRYHLVYEKGATLLGAISGKLEQDVAVINDIGVKKEERNRGIGAKLMHELLNRLKKDGIPQVRLWVHYTSATALPFYQRMGFKLKGVSRMCDVCDAETAKDKVFVLEKAIKKTKV